MSTTLMLVLLFYLNVIINLKSNCTSLSIIINCFNYYDATWFEYDSVSTYYEFISDDILFLLFIMKFSIPLNYYGLLRM